MESLGYWEFLYQSSSFGTCLAICCRFDNRRPDYLLPEVIGVTYASGASFGL